MARTPSGYSGKPLAKKLGITSGTRVVTWNAPDEVLEWLDPLPDDATVVGGEPGPFDVAIAFCVSDADLEMAFDRLEPLLVRGARLWIGWPKKSSNVATDLSFEVVQPRGLNLGIVDTKICAISDIWSALCFMRRTTV